MVKYNSVQYKKIISERGERTEETEKTMLEADKTEKEMEL